MKITLPLPPSDNRRLIFAKRLGRFISSGTYRAYKKIAQEILMLKYSGVGYVPETPTFKNQWAIHIKFFLKDKRRDATDMLKPLLDVMKGFVYTDDKWIVPIIHYPYYIDKKNPRVEIDV